MAMTLKARGVPVIVYVNGVSGILEARRECGADVISVDWRIDLVEARKRLGSAIAVQGNLDPTVLLAPEEVVVARTREMLEAAGKAPGYIFNLGHGILPQTEFEKVRLLVDTVKAYVP
jgi:uroporphyrinogen decarboxylase